MEMFYSRSLRPNEQEIADELRGFARGETRTVAGISVTRGNWGAYWDVTNRSGYRSETAGRVDTAVHVSNLAACYARGAV